MRIASDGQGVKKIEEDFVMFSEAVTGTNIVFYLMMAVGAVGVLAKVMNQITLRGLVKAAGNMQKSTHKLIKLVRAKYEHALMLHDRVENAEAFVEKYIYEYRGNILRIHTWRQLEVQSIWFSGILAVFGALTWYFERGFCEEVYRYIGLGAAEMVLLFVVSQLSDEQYKMEAAKNYMVDYLENVCAQRRRKTRQSEREQINVIQPESAGTGRAKVRDNLAGNNAAIRNKAMTGVKTALRGTGSMDPVMELQDAGNSIAMRPPDAADSNMPARSWGTGSEPMRGNQAAAGRKPVQQRNIENEAPDKETSEIPGLSICIEGEPHQIEEAAGMEQQEEGGRIVSIANGYEGGPGIQEEPEPAGQNIQPLSAYSKRQDADRKREEPDPPDQNAWEKEMVLDPVIEYDDLEDLELDMASGEDLEDDVGSDRSTIGKTMLHRAGKERVDPERKEESVMKEEVIRQILEEFLA